MTPKVYITNDSGLNFAKAELFGQLVPIIRGPVNIFFPERVKEVVDSALARFDFANDFLLVSGSSLVAGFAFNALSYGPDGSDGQATIKLLLYDSKRTEYFVRNVKLD